MLTRLLFLVLLLLAAASARTYQLTAQSIWFDEGWSAFAAEQPTVLDAANADATNPPLYYVLLNGFVRFTGDSELSLRWFSLLFGLLTIPLAYQLGKRVFNARAGLGAAFVTAFAPLLWWASQEARMYTLLAALTLGAALAWHTLLLRPARAACLALWGAELALLYAHNTGPVAALWLNTVTLLAWLAHRSFGKPDWKTWTVGQIGVAALWVPYFVGRFLLVPGANSAFLRETVALPQTLARLWEALWAGNWLMVGREPALAALSAALFLVALGVIPWRRAAARWLALHTLVMTGGLLLGLGVLGNEIHGRYLVMAVPPLLVAIGAGLAVVRWRSIRYGLAALFPLTLLWSIHLTTTNPAHAHDDARSMAHYYADHLTSDDTVLAWSYADRYDLAYYWKRLGVQANRATLPEGADLDVVAPLLPKRGDVALNIWYTQRADYRGMMNCLLANGTTQPPDEFTAQGMTSLVYHHPNLSQFSFQPLNAENAFARVTAVGAISTSTANQALCLPVQLELQAKTFANLKVSAIVQNSPGWEIARADAVFADAAQRLTSQLPSGERLTAYPLLRLPSGAPPGDYPVYLRVYDEAQQPSGYDLTNKGKSGKDVRVGTWRVQPGATWLYGGPDLPVAANLHIADDVELLAHDAQGGTFHNGDTLRLTLLWRGAGALPSLMLAGTDWQVNIPPPQGGQDDLTRDWRAAQIPPDAVSGIAELRLPDGTVLARYTIENIPAVYQPPAYGQPVGAKLSGVGRLVGYTLESGAVDRSSPVQLMLVWQAEGAAAVSYTVFAQLVTPDGRVIAQSDALPAGGARPTTGWRAGEYVSDEHTLQFRADASPGTASLIAGMYDAQTGERLKWSDGQDFVMLQTGIQVR
jgi:4-amino-4-deoxy-L-arabinose transferase-like glycosyltransferase